MSEDAPTNLPAPMASAIGNIAGALVPGSIKALNRLLGAVVDVPVAWLERQKAKIEARTSSLIAVEKAVGDSAAAKAGEDADVEERAVAALVSKTYRKQANREAVGKAMLDELTSTPDASDEVPSKSEVDDDWLNVFERYAEDASSERMQNLWGRVLAGEVRRPGRYSLRTLRFLSEFSQQDALTFSELTKSAFSDFIPKKLAKPDENSDITSLINLEAAGVLTGATGLGLSKTLTLNSLGEGCIAEDKLLLYFKGAPGTRLTFEVIILTPLGVELLGLIPNRDVRSAAKEVALAVKSEQIQSANVLVRSPDGKQGFVLEHLWG